MKLSGAQRIWEYLGYALAAYSMYEKLKTMNSIKADLFPYMTPSEQAIIAKYLGAPVPVVPVTAVAGVVPAPAPQTATTLQQVKSGT